VYNLKTKLQLIYTNICLQIFTRWSNRLIDLLHKDLYDV